MTKPRIAYLTIDDAPTVDFPDKLAWLAAQQIPAIFYCTGQNLEVRLEMAVHALSMGYVLGNHSWDHPHFSEISFAEAEDQIMSTDELLARAYREAGLPHIRTFRFPYGDKGDGGDYDGAHVSDAKKAHVRQLQDLLRDCGYHQPLWQGLNRAWYFQQGHANDIDVYWTYDCHEWMVAQGTASWDDLMYRMDEDKPEFGRGLNNPNSSEIILLHDHVETSSIFQALVERLQTKGLTFQLPQFENQTP